MLPLLPRLCARVLSVTGLVLLATACTPNATQVAATVAPTLTAIAATLPAPTATAPAPTPTTAPLATPTTPPAAPVLPAAVYFISAADEQIWRVERDGATLTQITHEAEPVSDYDVSPVDGSLVYFSGNRLILADAHGGSRQLVFSGPTDYPEDLAIHNELMHPRWSPDGARIAFGYGGILILELDSPMLTPNVLLPSDPYPDPNAGRPPTLLRFYRQALWSPDGSRLLVEYAYYPEGGGWAALLLNSDGALVEFETPAEGGLLCCDPTWSLDGQQVYFARPYVGLVSPGLRRVVAATGRTETLLAPVGDPGHETAYMVKKAQELASGELYYFLGLVEGSPDAAFTPTTMYRADAGSGQGSALRVDTFLLEEVLWAKDATGAVIMEVGPDSAWPLRGPLTWVPADGSDSVRLPAEGARLVWSP